MEELLDNIDVKWGITDSYSNAATLYSDQAVPGNKITVDSDGVVSFYSSKQKYFYLFIPYGRIDDEPEESYAPQIQYLPSGFTFTNMGQTIVKTKYDNSWEKQLTGGYFTYRIDTSENNSDDPITTNVQITYYTDKEEYVPIAPKKTHELTFKIVQEKKENPELDPSYNEYKYFVDKHEHSYSDVVRASIDVAPYPRILSLTYSYYGTSEYSKDISTFRFLYILDPIELHVELRADQLAWAKLVEIPHEYGKYTLYRVDVDAYNNSTADRQGIISIWSNTHKLFEIHLYQYSEVAGENPTANTSQYEDIDNTENKYWEGAGTADAVSVLDTNLGTPIDSTALLYKSNYANIYTTIEQKDGTLFAGNYTNTQWTSNIYSIMDNAINNDRVNIIESKRNIYIKTSSQDYSYIPDLTQNSQQKHIFKRNEDYAIGYVFVTKEGFWSSVYYPGKTKGIWKVFTSEEEIHLQTSNGSQFYEKPVLLTVFSKDVNNALYAAGIRAVIPVYAIKQVYSTKCQGFLSPSIECNMRVENETIDAQYSWFYRNYFSYSREQLSSGTSSIKDVEIQNLAVSVDEQHTIEAIWKTNRYICTLNTPETEVSEYLQDSELKGVKCRPIWNYEGFTYNNNLSMQTNGKYLYSKYYPSQGEYISQSGWKHITSVTDRRYITGPIWFGFLDNRYKRGTNGKNELLELAGNQNYYRYFFVYPWQRNIPGGEGEGALINSKRLFNSLYNDGLTTSSKQLSGYDNIESAVIYRNFDAASLLKLEGKIYQGNVDYIINTDTGNAYKAWSTGNNPLSTMDTSLGRMPYADVNSPSYPRANEDEGPYAGYDKDGNITDPISMRYKTAPHIVLQFANAITYGTGGPDDNALFCIELYDPNITLDPTTSDLQGYQWIKCGDMKRIIPDEDTVVYHEEGDHFFGRFDSLRTYWYAENDVNSVIEVVSGMLCSRVNLDARCDRNRGISSPTISPVNFNLFNHAYDQLNNYFTFVYVNPKDLIYTRRYNNSIQWSLTKEYSSDIDNWCNIQDVNTMDFDGDKGSITSIEKIGNELIVFQDTGVSMIQYNEKTQVATTEGVPIEITNSNKVTGKHYLYDHVGCQYKGSIAKTPNGIYFVDNINKSFYILNKKLEITDLCTTGGMRSWGLSNLDELWWSYYDSTSQEVVLSNNVESLAYSDSFTKFNSFLGYGGIRWNFRAGDNMIQICPENFKQVISTTTRTLFSNKRLPAVTKQHIESYNTFWKKNSIEETKFFDNYSPIEIQLQCNPEPTLDKTFSTIEYRVDCFDTDSVYLHDITFNTFRAWNEYQDTLLTDLKYKEGQEESAIYNTVYSTKLRKKFRIWRLDIPRAFYGNTVYVPGNTATVNNINQTVEVETDITVNDNIKASRDRIRNPWCNIYFSFDTSRAKKIVFNDLMIQYFK